MSKSDVETLQRVFAYKFGEIYKLYVSKIERKGRTVAELDEVISWLTGLNQAELTQRIADGCTLEQFFDDAHLNANAGLITGVVCGVRVEQIEDPLMQKIRYLDKLVDELAKGRALEKILR